MPKPKHSNTHKFILFYQLLMDYDDLRRIPYFRDSIEELTDEVVKLRYLYTLLCYSLSTQTAARYWHAHAQERCSRRGSKPRRSPSNRRTQNSRPFLFLIQEAYRNWRSVSCMLKWISFYVSLYHWMFVLVVCLFVQEDSRNWKAERKLKNCIWK